MVSIDLVYKTCLVLANSDIRGNVTPADLRLIINNVVNEIYEEYLFVVNQMTNRENRGLMNGGLENMPDKIREKIQYFLQDAPATFVTTLFQLPSDLRYFDSVYFNDTTEIKPTKNAREFKLVGNFVHTKPTEEYPIYLKQGTTIKVLPTTIQDNVTVFYLRNPLIAKWTYTVVSGAELFNPSALDFQDIDLHPSEEVNVILRTLHKFGINLKEQEIVAITQNMKTQDFNQDNAS